MELAHLSAMQIRRLIQRRKVSPVEVVQACLDQLDRHNEAINAVCTISEQAIDEARRAEQAVMRGEKLGLLHGLPVGIKDVTPVAGLRTTYGSTLYTDYIPTEDALIVQRLKAAGAIILGKTNVPEFALGANTFNPIFGPTRNPWNPELTAGGSTGGGAAALATGMITLAEGTDLGGSLRIPASFCGVVGLRPSPGLVPTYPSSFLWDTLNVTGCMARTAEDVALMLQAVAGPSPLVPICQPTAGRDFIAAVRAKPPQGLRLAYYPDIAGVGIDPAIELICRLTSLELAQNGAHVEEKTGDIAFAWEPYLDLRGVQVITTHHHRLDKMEQFGPNLATNLQSGLDVTTEELGLAEQARSCLWELFHEFFQSYDFLLTPCVAVKPFPVEEHYPAAIGGKPMRSYIDWVAPTFLLSLTGLPVASVPCGLTADGLPVGLQILGQPRDEEGVLALARQIQAMRPVGWPTVGG